MIELNPYQFLDPLDQQIILGRGIYYIRHEAELKDALLNGQYGVDAFPGVTAAQCFKNMACYVQRRDANLRRHGCDAHNAPAGPEPHHEVKNEWPHIVIRSLLTARHCDGKVTDNSHSSSDCDSSRELIQSLYLHLHSRDH